MLDGDIPPNIIDVATRFWEAALTTNEAEGRQGFGGFASVTSMHDGTWFRLTRGTLGLTNGDIDNASEVAKRAAQPPASADSLAILNSLVRRTSDAWDQLLVLEHAVQIFAAVGD